MQHHKAGAVHCGLALLYFNLATLDLSLSVDRLLVSYLILATIDPDHD